MIGKFLAKSFFPRVDSIGVRLLNAVIGLRDNTIIFSHRQNSGVDGGGTTLGAYRTYPINSEDYDPNGWASLVGNDMRLVAGTYEVDWVCTFSRTGIVKTRLYNVTAAAAIGIGLSAAGTTGSGIDESTSGGMATFTLAVQSDLRLQYFSTITEPNNGMGHAVTAGDQEVYGIVRFRRLY